MSVLYNEGISAWHCAGLWQAAPPFSALPTVYWGIHCQLRHSPNIVLYIIANNHCLVWVQAWCAQMSEGWLSGEDLLLARAMRRFGKQQLKIQQYFLPTRTVADISARIKHLTRISAPPNPVKVWPEPPLPSKCSSRKASVSL